MTPESPTACTGPAGHADTVEALKAQILGQQPVRCDEVQWRFLGLSLAGYNVLISLAMAALAAWGLKRTSEVSSGGV